MKLKKKHETHNKKIKVLFSPFKILGRKPIKKKPLIPKSFLISPKVDGIKREICFLLERKNYPRFVYFY
ncbi:MAG: hypothetical protein Q8879_02685 [Candidatus Phytoplasma australasiaticum]|nr:hypothetical protein [Candidatus Phytoplasma australasiaticum]